VYAIGRRDVVHLLTQKSRGAIVMRTGKSLMMLVAAATLVLTVSTAWAQPQGQGRRGGFRGGFGGGAFGADVSFLIASEPVQKELELTDDQKTKVQDLQQKLRDEGMDFFQSLQGLSQDEIQKKMQDRAKENRKKVADILVAPQMERLDEISIQLAGAGALTRPEVAEKLGLTEDQKKKLSDVAEKIQAKRMDLFQSFGGPPADDQERQDRQKKTQALTDEQNEQSLTVLTADQKDKFEKLKGKKFDTTLIQQGRGFGGGRGRGPGA
jgi:Spy/CpxP family protein refolding chaperone